MKIERTLPTASSIVLALVGTLLSHPRAFAAEGTVSGIGVEVIKRQPEILRMQIDLSAKGKTLAEALKKLAALREAASTQLASMSSEKEGTQAGEPRVNEGATGRQRQMEMMVRQRMRQAGKRNKKAPEKPVSVSCTLTAQWKLQGKTSEALLLEAQAIEDKVRAADLPGKNSEEKSAEEDELAEEIEGEMMVYDDGSQPTPGEPIFLFVTKISPQDRAGALAAAFAKARQQAEELSKAAGSELGALQALSRQESHNPFSFGMNAGYGNMRSQQILQLMSERVDRGGNDDAEAIGAQPSEVVLPISITASFQIK